MLRFSLAGGARIRPFPLVLALVAAAVLVVPAGARAGEATEIPILTSPPGEFQPARGDGVLAWEQNSRAQPNHYDVMFRRDGSSSIRVNGGRFGAAMGDFAGSRLIFQQYRKKRSDLHWYDLDTGETTKVAEANSRQWEYWPSISGDWLLFGRWNRRSDIRRLYLQNLVTEERRLLDKTKGAKAFIGPGQVEGNYAVWSTCRPRCNVFRYDISSESEQRIPNSGFYQRAPSVTPGGTVYFSRGGKKCGASVSLVRAPLEGPQEVLVELQKVLDIRDTYVYVEPNGSIEIYYERNGCGKVASGDIYMVREPALVTLSVQVERAGAATGTVTSAPQGITCGLDCHEDFERGTEVELTAGSGPGSVFVGWAGACSGSDPCTVTMDSTKAVAATFLPIHSVAIVKDSVPDDGQDFKFVTVLGGLLGSTFYLDDDAGSPLSDTELFLNVVPGGYQVTEVELPGGWDVTAIECLDPDGGSDGNVGSETAQIDLDPNEAVQCTFTNTKTG